MLILGIIVGILISVVGVCAATLVNSHDVTYDNSTSNLKSTNVQDALDELYTRINTKGTIGNGAIWNKSEGTVTLDGIDDYIDCGFTNYDFKNSISIVIRFKLLSKTSVGVIFNNAETAGATIIYEDNLWIFRANINGVYYDATTDFTNNTLNQIYTIIGTYDGSNLKIYLDGILKNTKPISGTIKISPVPFYIGANPGLNYADTDFTNIEVNDGLLYDRALTVSEISSTFSGAIDPTKVSYTSLLMYYDFKDNFYRKLK